jgi:hypothetical protein
MYEIKITVDSEREVSTTLEALGLPDWPLPAMPASFACGIGHVVEISQVER